MGSIVWYHWQKSKGGVSSQSNSHWIKFLSTTWCSRGLLLDGGRWWWKAPWAHQPNGFNTRASHRVVPAPVPWPGDRVVQTPNACLGMSLLEWGEGAVAALLIARRYCLCALGSTTRPVPPPSWLLCEGCSPFPDTPALWQTEIPRLQRVIPNTKADEKVTTQGLYGGKLKWPIVRIIKQNLIKYDSEKGWRDGEWILPFQCWRSSARIHVACLFPK